jgi:hypothetical protein
MRRIIIAVALAGVIAVPAFGQDVDPLIGTWKLNVEKPTFVGIPVLKSETLTITSDGPHFILAADTVDAQERTRKTVITHVYDGMLHPVTGNPNYDATSFRRIGNVISVARFVGAGVTSTISPVGALTELLNLSGYLVTQLLLLVLQIMNGSGENLITPSQRRWFTLRDQSRFWLICIAMTTLSQSSHRALKRSTGYTLIASLSRKHGAYCLPSN